MCVSVCVNRFSATAGSVQIDRRKFRYSLQIRENKDSGDFFFLSYPVSNSPPRNQSVHSSSVRSVFAHSASQSTSTCVSDGAASSSPSRRRERASERTSERADERASGRTSERTGNRKFIKKQAANAVEWKTQHSNKNEKPPPSRPADKLQAPCSRLRGVICCRGRRRCCCCCCCRCRSRSCEVLPLNVRRLGRTVRCGAVRRGAAPPSQHDSSVNCFAVRQCRECDFRSRGQDHL